MSLEELLIIKQKILNSDEALQLIAKKNKKIQDNEAEVQKITQSHEEKFNSLKAEFTGYKAANICYMDKFLDSKKKLAKLEPKYDALVKEHGQFKIDSWKIKSQLGDKEQECANLKLSNAELLSNLEQAKLLNTNYEEQIEKLKLLEERNNQLEARLQVFTNLQSDNTREILSGFSSAEALKAKALYEECRWFVERRMAKEGIYDDKYIFRILKEMQDVPKLVTPFRDKIELYDCGTQTVAGPTTVSTGCQTVPKRFYHKANQTTVPRRSQTDVGCQMGEQLVISKNCSRRASKNAGGHFDDEVLTVTNHVANNSTKGLSTLDMSKPSDNDSSISLKQDEPKNCSTIDFSCQFSNDKESKVTVTENVCFMCKKDIDAKSFVDFGCQFGSIEDPPTKQYKEFGCQYTSSDIRLHVEGKEFGSQTVEIDVQDAPTKQYKEFGCQYTSSDTRLHVEGKEFGSQTVEIDVQDPPTKQYKEFGCQYTSSDTRLHVEGKEFGSQTVEIDVQDAPTKQYKEFGCQYTSSDIRLHVEGKEFGSQTVEIDVQDPPTKQYKEFSCQYTSSDLRLGVEDKTFKEFGSQTVEIDVLYPPTKQYKEFGRQYTSSDLRLDVKGKKFKEFGSQTVEIDVKRSRVKQSHVKTQTCNKISCIKVINTSKMPTLKQAVIALKRANINITIAKGKVVKYSRNLPDVSPSPSKKNIAKILLKLNEIFKQKVLERRVYDSDIEYSIDSGCNFSDSESSTRTQKTNLSAYSSQKDKMETLFGVDDDDDEPIDFNDSSDDEPRNCKDSSDDEPIDYKDSSDDEPIACKDSSDDEPINCKDSSDDEPKDCKDSSDDEPIDCKDSCNDESMDCKASSDIELIDFKASSDNKSIAKSELNRIFAEMRSVSPLSDIPNTPPRKRPATNSIVEVPEKQRKLQSGSLPTKRKLSQIKNRFKNAKTTTQSVLFSEDEVVAPKKKRIAHNVAAPNITLPIVPVTKPEVIHEKPSATIEKKARTFKKPVSYQKKLQNIVASLASPPISSPIIENNMPKNQIASSPTTNLIQNLETCTNIETGAANASTCIVNVTEREQTITSIESQKLPKVNEVKEARTFKAAPNITLPIVPVTKPEVILEKPSATIKKKATTFKKPVSYQKKLQNIVASLASPPISSPIIENNMPKNQIISSPTTNLIQNSGMCNNIETGAANTSTCIVNVTEREQTITCIESHKLPKVDEVKEVRKFKRPVNYQKKLQNIVESLASPSISSPIIENNMPKNQIASNPTTNLIQNSEMCNNIETGAANTSTCIVNETQREPTITCIESPKVIEFKEVCISAETCEANISVELSAEEGNHSKEDIDDMPIVAKNLTWGKTKKIIRRLVFYQGTAEKTELTVKLLSVLDQNLLVNYLLTIVMIDKSEAMKGESPFEPWLTMTQKVIIVLLMNLENKFPNIMEDFITFCERNLLYIVKDVTKVMQITRIYAALCKMKKDKMRLRRTICDAMYFMNDLAVPFIYHVLLSWIQVLIVAQDEEQLKDKPLIQVLIQFVYTRTCTKPEYFLSVLKNLLEVYYKYPKERYNENNLIKDFLNQFICTLRQDFALAISILCKIKSNAWAYKQVQFIVELINVSKCENMLIANALVTLIKKIQMQMSDDQETNAKVNEILINVERDLQDVGVVPSSL